MLIILNSYYHKPVLTELVKEVKIMTQAVKFWTTFKSLPWFSPMNNWLLSCRWTCPSLGARCVAAGYLSTRSEASLMFRSARTLCHRLSFRGTFVSTLTSRGPFPTSKEKITSEEAKGGQWSEQLQLEWNNLKQLMVNTLKLARVSPTELWLAVLSWHWEIAVLTEWDVANP